jgi:hypothetical protein
VEKLGRNYREPLIEGLKVAIANIDWREVYKADDIMNLLVERFIDGIGRRRDRGVVKGG